MDIRIEDLPPTPFEIEQARHARVTQDNNLRERYRVRRANQARGFDEPTIGRTYHIQLDGSVTRRTRSGMRFERNRRVELTVVSDEDFAAAKARSPEAPVVTVLGAEYIIEDSALHVYETPLSDVDVDELKRSHAALEEEVRLTREDNTRLRAQLAERAARMSAPESSDGRPARLPAARAVRAAAEAAAAPTAPAPTHGDFGAEGKK